MALAKCEWESTERQINLKWIFCMIFFWSFESPMSCDIYRVLMKCRVSATSLREWSYRKFKNKIVCKVKRTVELLRKRKRIAHQTIWLLFFSLDWIPSNGRLIMIRKRYFEIILTDKLAKRFNIQMFSLSRRSVVRGQPWFASFDVFRIHVFCVYAHMLRLTQSTKKTPHSRMEDILLTQIPKHARNHHVREAPLSVCVCEMLYVLSGCECVCASEHLYAETCFEHVNSCRTTFHLIYVFYVCVCVCCVGELALLRCACSVRRRSTLNIALTQCFVVVVVVSIESLP